MEELMGYERYPRGTRPGDYYGSPDMDYGEDYGSGRSGSYSSARDYAASGQLGNRDQQGSYGQGRSGQGQGQYGQRDYGRSDYGRGNDYGSRDQGSNQYGGRDYGFERYGQREQFNRGRDQYGARGYGNQGSQGWDRDNQSSNEYHGSYGSGSRRFEDYGRNKHADDDRYNDPDQRYENRSRGGQQGYGQQNQGYGRQPQGYDYEDRGFLQRAGDEVRSWFGDEDAERRREMDSRFDERYSGDRDDDYRSWRSGQVASFDRDYHEYRQENRSKFENEFSSWRTNRQTQRDSLDKVKEHMEVTGSDGQHVGTVDKVRGDRIILTKNDSDAGGRHHSIPSSWLKSVDDKVTLTKTADEAKKAWRDEENKSAMFGDGDRNNAGQDHNTGYGSTGGTASSSSTSGMTAGSNSTTAGGASTGAQTTDADGKVLNKSFSGTY
jgi:hypothetical protein